jgi:hypothetical protein
MKAVFFLLAATHDSDHRPCRRSSELAQRAGGGARAGGGPVGRLPRRNAGAGRAAAPTWAFWARRRARPLGLAARCATATGRRGCRVRMLGLAAAACRGSEHGDE